MLCITTCISSGISRACPRMGAHAPARSVAVRKEKPLYLGLLRAYANGNRRAVLLYRLFAMRTVSLKPVVYVEYTAWDR